MTDNEKTGDDSTHDETEPTIHVDNDWKEQVAQEKDATAESDPATSDADTNPTHDGSADVSAAATDTSDTDSPEPPPASFSVLISMLFTQAMAMLGQMPDPSTGESKVNKPFAKHYIDTLEMLQSKTQGNLDDQESAMLNEALHALRMMYVDARG